MKVVLFCGGLGLRMGGLDRTPKPLTPIGRRPILWHLMRWYAHWGHTDLVLCLGHRADAVRRWVVREGQEGLPATSVTFVDTGPHASVGERLRAVEAHVGRDEPFLANYADGLSDVDLDTHVTAALASDAVVTLLAARPAHSFHTVDVADDGRVRAVRPVAASDVWLNAGFFVLRPEVFDHVRAGEDLVGPPFERLMARGLLRANRHEGFWQPMDTPKDAELLRDLHARGTAPWEVWDDGRAVHGEPVAGRVLPFAA